jgi:hypothetical protein
MRCLRRLAIAMAALLVVLALPVLWIEAGCSAPLASAEPASPLLDDPGYRRRESDSYLSYPEWHIVYAYDDLAAVLRRGDESDFAYLPQIASFWKSFCALNRVVTAREPAGLDTKLMLYTIGWSFSVEMALKGAYETTVGRLFEWLRGADKTAEDRFIAADFDRYAAFLRQTPWYEYPFASRLGAFWRETPLGGDGLARKLERRMAFSLEYGLKAVYAKLIGFASATALGAADLEIQSIVSKAIVGERVEVLRDLAPGRLLIRTPRYQIYTDLIVALARAGGDVVEIAGNDDILVTVLAPSSPLATVDGLRELFSLPIQSAPGRRRVGVDVRVAQLAVVIRTLEAGGFVVEHIYDY